MKILLFNDNYLNLSHNENNIIFRFFSFLINGNSKSFRRKTMQDEFIILEKIISSKDLRRKKIFFLNRHFFKTVND